MSEWMDRRMSAHRTLSPATAARHLRQLRQLRQLRVRGCRHRFLTGRCRGQVPRSALGHRQGPAREAESYAYWCAYMYGPRGRIIRGRRQRSTRCRSIRGHQHTSPSRDGCGRIMRGVRVVSCAARPYHARACVSAPRATSTSQRRRAGATAAHPAPLAAPDSRTRRLRTGHAPGMHPVPVCMHTGVHTCTGCTRYAPGTTAPGATAPCGRHEAGAALAALGPPLVCRTRGGVRQEPHSLP